MSRACLCSLQIHVSSLVTLMLWTSYVVITYLFWGAGWVIWQVCLLKGWADFPDREKLRPWVTVSPPSSDFLYCIKKHMVWNDIFFLFLFCSMTAINLFNTGLLCFHLRFPFSLALFFCFGISGDFFKILPSVYWTRCFLIVP